MISVFLVLFMYYLCEKYYKPITGQCYYSVVLAAGSAVKNPSANAGGVCLIPGWGRSPGKGNGNPL